ncbi:MAG: hypothetical protein MUC65_02195 [Pontiellaceae bacterium]|jgi:hypothetical protein|nr:hypothetical protein [Pontiellaceae bacterium]
MATMGDRVPMFRLRPYLSLLLFALFVLVVGGLLSAYFYEDSVATGSRTWLFVLIVTLMTALFLLVAAFSRYVFPHLRHHRPGYKRG